MRYNLNTVKYITTLLGVALLMIGCSGSQTENETAEKVISIKGEYVLPSSRQLTKEFTGTIEGERQYIIYSKINEAVEKIYVNVGQEIAAEAVVMALDKQGPSSNYLQTRSIFKNAEKNYNKMKYLYDQGAIAETQFDGAVTEYEVALANFDAARKLVELTSAIGGTVTSINVSPGDFVTAGQVMTTVARIDRVRMKLNVTGEEIKYFDIGDQVEVTIEGIVSDMSLGKVVEVARSADPDTRTFLVELEIDNASHRLMPGMFARANVIIETFDDIVAVSRSAVMNRNDKNYVFVMSGERSSLKEVILGTEFEGYVQINDGVNIGDTLITVGQEYLEDSSLVKLVRYVNKTGEEVEL